MDWPGLLLDADKNRRPDEPPDQSPDRLTFENYGRHYLLREPSYLFPCDSTEAKRMNVFHHAVSTARGGPGALSKIHSAPLRPDAQLRILDLGTGTGVWAIEMADLYAGRSTVWGVDIAPFQPNLIPANAKFHCLDIESVWQGIGPASWDLIHIRSLYGAVRAWAPLYRVLHHHLVPGHGHVEHVEIDWMPRWTGAAADDNDRLSPLRAWATILTSCMDRAGRSMRVNPPATQALLRSAGFVDVQQEAYRLPFGMRGTTDTTDGEAGRWFRQAFDLWLHGLTVAPLAHMGGYSRKDIDRLIQDVRQEVSDPACRAYCVLYIWTARRG